MKGLLKRGLKASWRTTQFIRLPIQRKFEVYLRRCLTVHHNSDSTILLDHVLRELLRLQEQIDYLQSSLEDLHAERERLTLVRDPSPERMKAG